MTSAGPDTVEAREAATAAGDKQGAGDAQGSQKRAYVRRIFSEIAPRYDLLNHVLSLNIDRRWRNKAVDALEWQRFPGGTYLDLCAGTLDVALNLARRGGFRGLVVASDFAEPMLRVALRKVQGRAVAPLTSDALSLPLREASMDAAIVAFGARNLADLDAGIREVFRVLRPGGRFVILEFSTPPNALIRRAYQAYFHHLLPIVGRVISGHRTAYRYLPTSVRYFPPVGELAERLTRAGFERVRWHSLTLGVAAIHIADKPALRA
jgi:demethylmenaquinone methyltransferase/2-methoxy-6-polyprenyl-1,4-benzoquinol methylase